MKRNILISLILTLLVIAYSAATAQDNSKGKFLGNLNDNKYDSNSISNPYGTYGSKYSSDSIKNPYSEYGSKYSDKSVTNPYTMNAPKIYDQYGNYAGKLSANKYDPDSINNPSSMYYIKRKNKNNNYSIYSQDPGQTGNQKRYLENSQPSPSSQDLPAYSSPQITPAYTTPTYTPSYTPVVRSTGPSTRKAAILSGITSALQTMQKQRAECDAANARYEEIEARTGIPQPRMLTPDEQVALEEKTIRQYGDTYLTWHIKCGNTLEAERLIKRDKYIINEANKAGQTPLMLARLYKLSNVSEMLLEKGAKTNLRDRDGKGADDYEKMPRPAFFKLFD